MFDDCPEELFQLRLWIALSAWEAVPDKENLRDYDDPLVEALRNFGEENRRLRNLLYLSSLKLRPRRKNAAKPKPASNPRGRPGLDYEKFKDFPWIVEQCKEKTVEKTDRAALLWLLQNHLKMNRIRAEKEVKRYECILYRVRKQLNLKQ